MLLAICAFAFIAIPEHAFAAPTTFAVLADTHVSAQGDGGNMTNNADALRAFKWAGSVSGLDAIIVAGDLTDRGYSSEFVLYNSLWQKVDTTAPRIQCIGNHDTNHGGLWSGLSVGACASQFKSINKGKITDYQEFDNANVMTIGGPYRSGGSGVYTKSMLKKLNKYLKKTVRQGKMAVVVSHYPYTTRFANSDRLLSILKSYPNVIYISGHVHYYSSKKWMQKVKPKAIAKITKKKTPYKRAGIKAKKAAYAFKSLGVDSVTRYHSVGSIWQSSGQSIGGKLDVSDNGRIVYKRYNMKNGKCLKTWKMKQLKGSVTVKPVSTTKGKKGTVSYRVTFSDGGTYGGVKSGGTLKVATGKSKIISGIPAGVLVTVQGTGSDGWSKTKKAKIEVTGKNRNVVLKHSYKKPKSKKSSSSSASSSTSSSSVEPSESSSSTETPIDPIDEPTSSSSEEYGQDSTSSSTEQPSPSASEPSESSSTSEPQPSEPDSSSSTAEPSSSSSSGAGESESSSAESDSTSNDTVGATSTYVENEGA